MRFSIPLAMSWALAAVPAEAASLDGMLTALMGNLALPAWAPNRR